MNEVCMSFLDLVLESFRIFPQAFLIVASMIFFPACYKAYGLKGVAILAICYVGLYVFTFLMGVFVTFVYWLCK